MQHEIVTGEGFQGWVWLFLCRSLMTGHLFNFFSNIIPFLCVLVMDIMNTSHWAQYWYALVGVGMFLYTTSSLPHSPGIKQEGNILRAHSTYVKKTGRWGWEHYFITCCCFGLRVDVPTSYLWRDSSLRWSESLGNTNLTIWLFNGNTHTHTHRQNLSFSLLTAKLNQFSLPRLAFIAIYCFSRNIYLLM